MKSIWIALAAITLGAALSARGRAADYDAVARL